MIGPIISEAYDFEGVRTLIPVRRSTPIFRPTFPMGRFVRGALKVECKSISDIRRFLSTCRYVPDEEQFGRRDYWLAPEEFEVTRAGDCEDFALWTWRQFLALGHPARFVVGESGRYGAGHAWLNVIIGGQKCLVEPLRHWLRRPMPRLSTVRYEPEVSVEWDGEQLRYFKHARRDFEPSVAALPSLALEWLGVWAPLWPRIGRAFVKRGLRFVFSPLRRVKPD